MTAEPPHLPRPTTDALFSWPDRIFLAGCFLLTAAIMMFGAGRPRAALLHFGLAVIVIFCPLWE